MSIRHDVTINCDTCGHWIHADGVPTRARRREGWSIWQEEGGRWRHKCPTCTHLGREICWICGQLVTKAATPSDGEANSFWATADQSTCRDGRFHDGVRP